MLIWNCNTSFTWKSHVACRFFIRPFMRQSIMAVYHITVKLNIGIAKDDSLVAYMSC
jgi:hypothetical protein